VERDGLSGFELAVLGLGGAALLVVGAVWAGAALALLVSGHAVVVSLADAAAAVPRLAGHAGEPAGAWPPPGRDDLPNAVIYWAATVVAVAATVGATAVLVRWCLGPRVGSVRRRPLGVDGRAWFARRRELAPLLIRRPVPRRFVLARFGRWFVATEDRSTVDADGPLVRLVRRPRRGDRGAVALIGPARCGKTAAAVAGILEWEGPAVLSSVKTDLLGPTLRWRSTQGQARVFDPTGASGGQGQVACWSPVRQAGTVIGAQRAARALCEAAPRDGVEGGLDFWLAQAEILLCGLLYVAHHMHRDMGSVCDWVLSQDRPGDLGPGEVRTFIDALKVDDDPVTAAGTADACRGLLGVWDLEDRTLSSVYSTAQTVVWPWSEPGVVASSRGESVDLDWLLSSANTVYLCAPIEDQRRLAPAFGGLLNDLIAQAYRRVSITNTPLDPPLLIVIDEAGNTQLRALPEYASTLAGIGVVLVTIWQSLAQVEAAYGRQADTILTNHLTKLFYAGLSDAATLRYLGQVLGDAEVETVSRSTSERMGRGSIQWAANRTALAPPHALRQMRPGEALLLHGTLPPAHVRTRAYFRDRDLADRAAGGVVDEPVRPAAARLADRVTVADAAPPGSEEGGGTRDSGLPPAAGHGDGAAS
jgi:type IV secretion system protein VirD4